MKDNNCLLRNNMRCTKERWVKWWVKRFYWFLFWHRSLNKYLRECGQRQSREGAKNRFELLYGILVENRDLHYFFPEDFIDSQFVFDRTEDGLEFWSELNDKWLEVVLEVKDLGRKW